MNSTAYFGNNPTDTLKSTGFADLCLKNSQTMKVFLTGSTGQYRILSPVGFSLRRLLTGNIGSGVLEACLRDPNVTAIVALSRRPLKVEDSKLKVIINDDFSTYSEEVLEEALLCDGAIWWVMFCLSSLLEYHQAHCCI